MTVTKLKALMYQHRVLHGYFLSVQCCCLKPQHVHKALGMSLDNVWHTIRGGLSGPSGATGGRLG